MDSRAIFFKTLNEYGLVPLGAKYYDEMFFKSKRFQNKFNKVAGLIARKSPEPKQDLENLIHGTVMATPFSKEDLLDVALNAATERYSSVTESINYYLEIMFEKNDLDLFGKLQTLQYEEKKSDVRIQFSRDPEKIKKFVKQTNACINDDPLRFFSQIVEDNATVYLIAGMDEEFDHIETIPKKDAHVAYARLYLYQSRDKQRKYLAVDNVWFSKTDDKVMINTMVDAIHDIGSYLNLNIIDTAITSNFLTKKGDVVEIVTLDQDIFKMGRTPIINRYVHTKVPKASYFYEIASS